jgi:hypothetical protein
MLFCNLYFPVNLNFLFVSRRACFWRYFSVGLFLFSCSFCANSLEAKILVSPDGTDGGVQCNESGVDFCLKGLSVQSIGRFLNKDSFLGFADAGPVNLSVKFVGGVYRLKKPIFISWGAKHQGSLVLEGAASGGQEALFVGTKEVLNWRKADSAQFGCPISKEIEDKLLVADIDLSVLSALEVRKDILFGASVYPGGDLFIDNVLAQPSVWPSNGFGKISAVNSGRKDQIRVVGASRWSCEKYAYSKGYFSKDWAQEIIRIKHFDEYGDQFNLTSEPAYGSASGQRIKVYNVFQELRAEGQWYIDGEKRLLYLIPGLNKSFLAEVSVVNSGLVVADSRDVKVIRLNFQKFTGDGVVVRKSRKVNLSDSIVGHVGGRGIVIENSFDSGVTRVNVADTGLDGIYLNGGDRQTLLRGGLFVVDSVVTRFARRVSTYHPGVNVNGVGNSIERNKIYSGPHSAIVFNGNDHLISNNHIFDVVLETGDAGAIYTGRNWTAQGSNINSNYIHDIGGGFDPVVGVYLDDQASGVNVFGNLFARVPRPVLLGGGRSNSISWNVFYESNPNVVVDARGVTWQVQSTRDPNGDLMKRLMSVPFDKPPYSVRYPNLAMLLSDGIGRPKYNVLENNLSFRSGPFRVAPEVGDGLRVSGNVEENNLLFLDVNRSKRVSVKDFMFKSIGSLMPFGNVLSKLLAIPD